MPGLRSRVWEERLREHSLEKGAWQDKQDRQRGQEGQCGKSRGMTTVCSVEKERLCDVLGVKVRFHARPPRAREPAMFT